MPRPSYLLYSITVVSFAKSTHREVSHHTECFWITLHHKAYIKRRTSQQTYGYVRGPFVFVFLRPTLFWKQEHVTYRTSPNAEPNILIATLPLHIAYWEGRVLWRALWNSRTRSVHLFQKSLNPEEKFLHLHMVVLLFLYKEHATPWAPYINTFSSKFCCLSAYPNIVHIIALSYTPRQVDPCMRYFAFVNILVCPKLSESISVKFYIGFCINNWKSNLILVCGSSVFVHFTWKSQFNINSEP